MLPVIAWLLMLPVMNELFPLLNFETTDLLTDNFELKIEAFIFFYNLWVFVIIYDTKLHRFQR